MADYTNPNTPVKENPIGLEVPIQSIQLDIATIPWMQASYGRAFVHPIKKGSTVVEPMVYVGARGYKRVLPNDNFKSQSFLAITSAEEIEEFNHNSSSQTKSVDLAVIIWVNFEKIEPNNKEIFIESLKSDVEKILSFNQYVIAIEEEIDEDAREIFRGYNIELCEKELLMYPYGGLRFNIKIGYESFCQ